MDETIIGLHDLVQVAKESPSLTAHIGKVTCVSFERPERRCEVQFGPGQETRWFSASELRKWKLA